MSEQNTAHGDPMPDRPHPLEGLLEPESRYHAAAHEHAVTSIAISLKRIADHLDAINPTSNDFKNHMLGLAAGMGQYAGEAFTAAQRRNGG